MDLSLRLIIALLLLSLGCSHGEQVEFEKESADEVCVELSDRLEGGGEQDAPFIGIVNPGLIMALEASVCEGVAPFPVHDALSEWWTIARSRAPPAEGASVAPSEIQTA